MKFLDRLQISINKWRVKRAKTKAIKHINKLNKKWGIYGITKIENRTQ